MNTLMMNIPHNYLVTLIRVLGYEGNSEDVQFANVPQLDFGYRVWEALQNRGTSYQSQINAILSIADVYHIKIQFADERLNHILSSLSKAESKWGIAWQ